MDHGRIPAAGVHDLTDHPLIERCDLDAGPGLDPGLDLLDRLGVLDPGDLLHLLQKIRLDLLIHGRGLPDEGPVEPDAPVVDRLVDVPQIPLRSGDAESLQLLPDRPLRFNVPPVVLDELGPLLRSVLRQVPRPLSVGLGRPAGHREEPDQVPSLADLLLVLRKTKDDADVAQGPRKAKLCSLDHGIEPLLRRHRNPQMSRQAGPFKISIVGRFHDIRILQGRGDRIELDLLRSRERWSLRCHVDHVDRIIVKGIGQQQDLK